MREIERERGGWREGMAEEEEERRRRKKIDRQTDRRTEREKGWRGRVLRIV